MLTWRLGAGVLGSALLLACSSSDTSGHQTGPAPSIAITSPMSGANVTPALMQDGTDVSYQVELAFTVTNFTLKQPGTCGGAAACGHVHLKIDGDACNDTGPTGKPLSYNEEVWQSPTSVDFLYCPGVTLGPSGAAGAAGMHDIAAELHGDDESPVNDAAGQVVHADVHVNVVESSGSTGGGGAGGGSAGGGGTAGSGGA